MCVRVRGLRSGIECGRRCVLFVVVRVRRRVRRVVHAAVLGCCIVLLVRHVLRAAMHGRREMSATKLRGSDGALLADEGFVVGLRVRCFPLSPRSFLRT